jgi:hypothetical protein
MQSNGNQKRSGAVTCVIQRVCYGLISGAMSGPIVVIAWMFSLDFLYPETQWMATGFEVPGSLIVGAILGAIEGPLLGLLWAIRPRRLTLWWLMVAVAILALTLGLFKFNPILGLFAITVPLMMAVLMRIVALIPPAAQIDERVRLGSDPRPQPGARHRGEPEVSPQSIAWLYERRTRWQDPTEMGSEPDTRNGDRER